MDNMESILIIKLKNNIIGVYNNINIALDYIYSLINSKIINMSDSVIIEKIKINSCVILEELIVDLKYIITKKKNINYSDFAIISGGSTERSGVDAPDLRSANEGRSSGEFKKLSESVSLDLLSASESSDTISFYEEDSFVCTSINEDKENSSEKKEKHKQMIKKFVSDQNKLGQEKIFITHELNLLKEKQKILEEEENIYKNDLELFYKFKNLKNNNSRFEIPFMFNQKYLTFIKLEESNSLSLENFKNIYLPEQIKTTYDSLFNNNQKSKTLVIDHIDEIYSNESSDEQLFFIDVDNVELMLVTGDQLIA